MDQRARASGGTPLLSLEALLDEENKEVLAGLTKQRSRSPAPPKGVRGRTPPPYRSMLDVDAPAPRHGSIAGIGVGITSLRDQRKPSARLDPGDPSTWTKPSKALDPGDPSTWTKPAKPASPTTARSQAPTDSSIPQGLPKIQIDDKHDFEQTYNFDMASMPLSGGGAKSTQEHKRDSSNNSAKNDASNRRSSNNKSSPTGFRHSSPAIAAHLSPDSPKAKTRTSSGSAHDEARRRLSNKSSSFSTIASESDGAPARVMADIEDEDEDAVADDSSDEEQRVSSSDEETADERGRRREKEAQDDGADATSERKEAPQSQGVRSLLDPPLSPSMPHPKSNDVHPPTSFGRSGPTAADFADEDEYETDIQRAKNMGVSMSPIDNSIPNRHVRMIIRGEWSKFQDDNENHGSSPRTYLACTDLSTEASYAMEWTVGTMLRDGDSLLAIYAIEDESAPKEPENNAQVMHESAKAAQDASDAMETLTRQTTNLESRPQASIKFVPAIDAPTAAGSSDLRHLPRREIERIKALDEITANFLKLVRKTPLQVRCMIEVIHCQSPKHLILNAIDTIEPTLCVVGTRGRSSLKGVLLGSFSNYLVTKSSVPVMVARKRLKKPAHAKVNSTSIRLSNNLTNTLMPRARRSLTQARID